MKNQKLSLLLILPLLASCGSKELVIPTVDVEHLNITLPTKPAYNQGAIRSDETYDYLDLYELSDFHGAVNYEAHSSGDYLGFPKLASYMDIKRKNNEGGTLLLSSGDMFQGSAESNLTRGYMVNYAMNYMGFDSMTLGNHEFDWTSEWIKKNANLEYNGRKIPFLGANIVEKATNQIPEYLSKSTTVTRGDYKIGIIGTIGGELESSIAYSCVSSFDFKPEKSIVEEEATRLRNEENCDVVIWTTHNGLDLIPTVNGVDAIFGGHAHENKAELKGTVPAVATKNYGTSVGHIELKINKNTKQVSSDTYEYDATPNTLAGIKEDTNVKSIINQYSSAIDKIKNIKLGSTKSDLLIEVELKNICVDALQESAKKAATENSSLGVDPEKIIASYHNVNGGIRANISAGNITYGDVYKPFPFDNSVVLYKINGKTYKNKCISKTFSSWAIWHSFASRSDLLDNEEYYIVITDFMALSSNYLKAEFPEITEADLIYTGGVVRDVIANYIYERKTINPTDYSNRKKQFTAVTRY